MRSQQELKRRVKLFEGIYLPVKDRANSLKFGFSCQVTDFQVRVPGKPIIAEQPVNNSVHTR